MKEKFTSRKFLVALGGILGGILLILTGNTAEGVTATVTAVIGYLAAEGLIDLAAVRAGLDREEEERRP